MAKDKSDPITFIGGPYHYKQQKMKGCLKTIKIKTKDYIGHYERYSLHQNNMVWEECPKRWYTVSDKAIISDEKMKKLGCLAIVEPTTHWSYNKPQQLVRRIGIDIDSPFSAFELYYAEHIVYISDVNYKTLYEYRGERQ
jgi:hypothetical protein